MREPIRIKTVHAGDEQGLVQAIRFAASFDHELQMNHLPVHILSRGNRPFAFFQHLRLVTAFPSFHTDPAICTPRDTLEGGNAMRIATMMAFGGCIIEASAEPASRFTPDVLSKLDFEPRNSRLYQAKNLI